MPRGANGPASKSIFLSPIIRQVELRPALGGEFLRTRAVQTVTNRQHITDKLVDARDDATGVRADHAAQSEAGGLDDIGALVASDPAEAHRIFAAGELELHLIEHHLRRL